VLWVFADHELGRYVAVSVDDDSMQSSATTDLRAREHDAELNHRIGVHTNTREQQRAFDGA
jgi:hypothetical protein